MIQIRLVDPHPAVENDRLIPKLFETKARELAVLPRAPMVKKLDWKSCKP